MNSRLLEWFSEIAGWLREQWVPVLGVLAIFGVIVWCSVFPKSRTYCGLFLQVLGMLIALKGLFELRKRFKLDLIQTIIKQWWVRFPRWNKETVRCDIGGIYPRLRGSCYVSTSLLKDQPNDTIENRIDLIFRNLDILKTAQDHDFQQIGKIQDELIKLSKENKLELDNAKEKLREELKQSLTDDIFSSMVGLILVLVGVVISTV